jgi:hypothetical protein
MLDLLKDSALVRRQAHRDLRSGPLIPPKLTN